MGNGLILIVEDDPDIVELLAFNLKREGFDVRAAGTGEDGLKIAADAGADVIVLDVMLPGIDGFEVCRRLRAHAATAGTPILMLTARGSENDMIAGFEAGADDYVKKPFSPREVLARVRAIRRRPTLQHRQVEPERTLRAGPIAIDPERCEVRVGDARVELTLSEYRVLQALVAARGRVLSRDQLLDAITGGDFVIIDRNVDTHVRSVRKKLGDERDRIVTVRGVGYKCDVRSPSG